MDPRNVDARDLVPPPQPVDPDFPKTAAELRALIAAEVRAEVTRVLSTVPRGEE